MEKYFDIHNHLFNKHFLAKELLYRMMKELKKFLHFESEQLRETEPSRGLKQVIEKVKRFRYAIKVFSSNDSTAIFKILEKTYNNNFILIPLTFDLTWCFTESSDRDTNTSDIIDEALRNEIKEVFDLVEENTREMSRDVNPNATSEQNGWWTDYLNEKNLLMDEMSQFQKNIQVSDAPVTTREVFKKRTTNDGWLEQLRQIEELKNNPDFKDMVYPFLAVDPRRKWIDEYAMKNVGKGKLFAGIKLYCPNGYSPTDPLLFGPPNNHEKGGIYEFCEMNGIPVTAHNSDGGFATLSQRVVIDGLIHHQGELIQMNQRGLKFKTKITQKDAIYERATTLNHPLIWEKVAEKYPNLKLNLAHFGGGDQLDNALTNPDDETLWSNRIIALAKNKNYKVYTDLSCFTDFSTLRKFYYSSEFQQIKDRVLYGSDFTLILLFENDFDKNVQDFQALFGADFDIIARENPKEFLKNVI